MACEINFLAGWSSPKVTLALKDFVYIFSSSSSDSFLYPFAIVNPPSFNFCKSRYCFFMYTDPPLTSLGLEQVNCTFCENFDDVSSF